MDALALVQSSSSPAFSYCQVIHAVCFDSLEEQCTQKTPIRARINVMLESCNIVLLLIILIL